MTISRVKFPWPPFFRIFIFFDEVFNTVCGTTYLMRDDGATVVNVRSRCGARPAKNETSRSCLGTLRRHLALPGAPRYSRPAPARRRHATHA